MAYNVGILPVDSSHPNYALMKVSAYYKRQGAEVEFYTPFARYDVVYVSKIFSFSPDYERRRDSQRRHWLRHILTTNFVDYQPRKGFKCVEYFKKKPYLCGEFFKIATFFSSGRKLSAFLFIFPANIKAWLS